jgi:glycosyltransferase involved in cell wall biosynthesis
MKVLLITQFVVPHGGGLSSHVEDLLSCLSDNGHEVELLEGTSIITGTFRKLFSFIISGGIRDLYWKRRLEIALAKLAKQAEKTIRDNSFDIIHCHDAVAGGAVHLALSKTEKQIQAIETIHGPLAYESKMVVGYEFSESKYLQRLLDIERQAFIKAAHLIAVDTGQANIAINNFGIDKSKISVIFNSVSCEKIDSIIKEAPRIKVPKPYLLVPRRLVEKTGVRVAIESLAKLDSDVKVNLAIAGEGPLKNTLKQLTEDLGLGRQVIFLGSIPREEVLRLAKEALAVVVPSIPSSGVVEATSIAAIEAMACGTAAIASDIGGLAELIQHNQTGFLVPHSEPEALSEAVGVLLRDEDLRNSVCMRAREYVLEKLDTSVWFSKVLSIYENVLTNQDI